MLRAVLGISFDELAIAVAREWKFPDAILDSLKPLPAGAIAKPTQRGAALAAASGFAYGLVQMSTLPAGIWRDAMLEGHVQRFADCLPMTVSQTREMLAAALAKYQEFAPLLGVPCSRSRFLNEAADLAGPEASAKFAAGSEHDAGESQTRESARKPTQPATVAAPAAAAAPRAPAAAARAAPPSGIMRRALRWLGRPTAGT